MEFEISSYTALLNGSTITLEHNETYRIYKRVFKESEFAEYFIYGGLDWVLKGLQASMEFESASISATESHISLTFVQEGIPITVEIPAAKQQRMYELNKKIKDLQLENSALTKKIEEPLDYIVIPELLNKSFRIDTSNGWNSKSDTIPVRSTISATTESLYIGSTLYMLYNLRDIFPEGECLSEYKYTDITCSPHEITYLSNLEKLENLQFIGIGLCHIKDLKFLEKCKSLRTLFLIGQLSCNTDGTEKKFNCSLPITTFKSLEGIQNLTSLTHVSFAGCSNLEDVSLLSALPNLKVVDLRFTGVKNISFLERPGLTIII